MLRRFWEAACRGGYPGHGETYMNPDDILWWSHGGTLHGESWKRFELLHDIMCETPGNGLMPLTRGFDEICAVPQEAEGEEKPVKDYYLMYYSFMRPSTRNFPLNTPLSSTVISQVSITFTRNFVSSSK